jgi:hypothetical protein
MVSNKLANDCVKELKASLNFVEDHSTVHRKLKMAIDVINSLTEQIDDMRSRPLTDSEMYQLLQKALKVEDKEYWKVYCRLIEKEHGIN